MKAKKDTKKKIKITPKVKSISGVIKLDKAFVYKKEYYNYIEKKYK